jgi:lysophospholipase L1-like esterase
VAVALVCAGPCLAAAKVRSRDPNTWARTIAKFEQEDKKTPPPADAVLLVGSSSFTTWRDAQSYFPNDKLINRGFGASTLPDVNHYIDRIVIPYRPRIIFLYCGGNDLAILGHSPEMVRDSFRTFARKVREKLPDTPIVFISIHCPPGRPTQKEPILKANKLLAAECAEQTNVTYLDIHDDMLGPDAVANKDLYKDKLHPGARGYALWVKKMMPLIEATRPTTRPSGTGAPQAPATRPSAQRGGTP